MSESSAIERLHQTRVSVASRAVHFPFQNFMIDRMVPRSRGADDEIENLQPLGNVCDSKKGTKRHAGLIAIRRADGTLN